MKNSILFALIAIFLSVGQTQARELRFASAAPAKSPWGQYFQVIADKVNEASGGELQIQLFLSSQLGDEQTTVRQVVRGRIDMAGLSNTAISLVVPEFGLLAAPFLWQDHAQADCVADNHLLAAYRPLLEESGLIPLTWMEVGYQIIFAKDPIATPGDLSGVKIRTAPTKTDTLYIEQAGGNAIPIGTAETMPALKTGVVNAATWPTVYGIAVGYHEVASNVTVTNHSHQLGGVVISKRVWDGLSEQEQGWLQKANDEVGFIRDAVRKAEQGLLEKIASAGSNVIRPDAEQLASWQALAPTASEKIVAEYGDNASAVWQQIEQAKQACQN